MPIPDKIKMSDCVGKYAYTDREIINGAGQGIAKGSRVKIVSFGRSLTIQTEPCKSCGQFTKIRNVNKNSLTLEDGNNKTKSSKGVKVYLCHACDIKFECEIDCSNGYKCPRCGKTGELISNIFKE